MSPTTLAPGTRIGPYEILSALGAGGMGEVYRARDSKLNRDVAIKVLLAAVAGDPDRLARFSREAQVLASLNHPNIGAIYGLEESGEVRALVMELVEGPTLADRIADGPIPLTDALPIAKQIAEALEAAHDQGIIHRDLKPANIKVRPDGTVKVLDFGLAKAIDSGAASSANTTNSPTLSMHATQAGIILGTAAYMSPEQARGFAVDRRADLWAFGAVLFEMLTGVRIFEGATVSDSLAAVLRAEPNWTALPSGTPASIHKMLRRCLEKDRKRRLDSAADARLEIEDALSWPLIEETARAARPPRKASIAVALAGAALAAALGTWAVMRPAGHLPPRLTRFTVVPPASQPMTIQSADRGIAISADGARIVYRGGTTDQPALFVRALDQLDVRAIPLAGPALDPFISPDGRWIGFFTNTELKKVPIDGGAPVTICRTSGAPRGATWGPDDTIIFATATMNAGLMRVPAGGGEPRALTTPEAEPGSSADVSNSRHFWPSLLPGGRAVLFSVRSAGAPGNSQIAVFDLNSGQQKTLPIRGTTAHYVGRSTLPARAVQKGYLVYLAGGRLQAVGFDQGRLEVTTDPVPAVDGVMATGGGEANFAVSQNGTLVYVPDSAKTRSIQRSLVWVDRNGNETPLKIAPRAFAVPRLSPDGTRIAIDIRDQEQDIWIWDVARETLSRLTFDPSVDVSPTWTHDGQRLIWASPRDGGYPNLYWQAADGTGTAERMTTSPLAQFATSVSPDGSRLAGFEVTTEVKVEVGLINLSGTDRRMEPLVGSGAVKFDPEISPDGRWLAYHSNESGRFEVYVRPFPKVDSGRWLVSTNGGTRAAWAPNGRELFYLDAGGLLSAVPLHTTATTFGAGTPARILKNRYHAGATTAGFDLRGYDVSPDGQRFLMIKESTAPEEGSAPAGMVVVEQWLEELMRIVPTT